MIEKVFLDTNVIIDIVENRKDAPFVQRILEYARKSEHTHVYASYLAMADTAFVIRKRGAPDIRAAISALMKVIDVLPCNDSQIMHAGKCHSPDYEDSLQIACAESKDCDVIITHNTGHFRGFTEIPVITPEEFVSHCR